jgi:hypothetical protein
MILMGIWTIGSGVELLTNSFFIKLFSHNIVQVVMAFVAIANYAFVIHYTSFEKRIYRWMLCVFLFLNTVYAILLFTDTYHHLLRSNVEMVFANDGILLTITSTTLGLFCAIFQFTIFGIAAFLLCVFLIQTFKSMRKQVIMITLGLLFAIILLVIKRLLLAEIGTILPTPIILIFPYIIIGIGIFQYDFLSISPFTSVSSITFVKL